MNLAREPRGTAIVSLSLSLFAGAAHAALNVISIEVRNSTLLAAHPGAFPPCDFDDTCRGADLGPVDVAATRLRIVFSERVAVDTATNPTISSLWDVTSGPGSKLDVSLTVSTVTPMPPAQPYSYLDIDFPSGTLASGHRYQILLLSNRRRGDSKICCELQQEDIGIQTVSTSAPLVTNHWRLRPVTGCPREREHLFLATFEARAFVDPAHCPDAQCDPAIGENCRNCVQDCGSCPPECDNDGNCDPDESAPSCIDCVVTTNCAPTGSADSFGDDARFAQTPRVLDLGTLDFQAAPRTVAIAMRNVGTTTWGGSWVCRPMAWPLQELCFPEFTIDAVAVRNVTFPGYTPDFLDFVDDVATNDIVPIPGCAASDPQQSVSVRYPRLRVTCTQNPLFPPGSQMEVEIDWQMRRHYCLGSPCSTIASTTFGEIVTSRLLVRRPLESFAGETGPDQDCDGMTDSVEDYFLQKFRGQWRFNPQDCGSSTGYFPARFVPVPWDSPAPSLVLAARDATLYGQAYPLDFLQCEYCVHITTHSIWDSDCGCPVVGGGHPGDREKVRALVCAPTGDKGGPNAGKSQWRLRRFRWAKHENSTCEYTWESSFNSATANPEVWVVKDKHGTTPSAAACPTIPLARPECVVTCDNCGGDVPYTGTTPTHYQPINLGEYWATLNDTGWVRADFYSQGDRFQSRNMGLGPAWYKALCGGIVPCTHPSETCDTCDEARIVPVHVDGLATGSEFRLRILDQAPTVVDFDSIRVLNYPPSGAPVETSFPVPSRDEDEPFAPIEITSAVGNALRVEYKRAGTVIGCMKFQVDNIDPCLLETVELENLSSNRMLRPESGVWSLRGRVDGSGPAIVAVALDNSSEFYYQLPHDHARRFVVPLAPPAVGGHTARIEAQLDYGDSIRILIKDFAFGVE